MNGSKSFLITNHASNHSAEDWAAATADHLVHVRDGSTHKTDALRLELAIIEILTGHHDAIKNKANVTQETDDAFDKVIAASVGTPFETLWADETVQNQIYDTLFAHFNTSAELESAKT